MQQPAVARVAGSRVLEEIEETSLDEILSSFRATIASLEQQQQQQLQQQHHPTATAVVSTPGATARSLTAAAPNRNITPAATSHHRTARPPKTFPFAPLNAVIARHFDATRPWPSAPPLAVSGRYLPLLYALIAALVAPPLRKAVVVVDLDGRFDVARLLDCVPFSGGEQQQKAHEQGGDGVDRVARATAPGIEGPDAMAPNRGISTATTAAAATAPATAPATANMPSDMPPPPPPPGRIAALLPADLEHVHVSIPPRGSDSRARAAESIAAAEQHMLYGRHGSRGREWWGTIVLGGDMYSSGAAPFSSSSLSTSSTSSAAAASRAATAAAANSTITGTTITTNHNTVTVTAGWKGWLRVDREEVRGFAPGMSIEEALVERRARQAAVEESGWVARSGWGGFVFGREGRG